jgi:transcriptional regulator with XRE-family HTH domain
MESIKVQIKAARTLAGMSQAELCELAGVPLITLRRIEGKPSHKGLVSEETVVAICKELEARGVQFLESGQVAAGPGVALGGNE